METLSVLRIIYIETKPKDQCSILYITYLPFPIRWPTQTPAGVNNGLIPISRS